MNIDFAALLKAIGKEGQAIIGVRLTLADGSTVEATLPAETPAIGLSADAEFRVLVLAELARQRGPVSAKQLGAALGWKSGATGRNGQMLRAMIDAGEVLKREGLLYDAPHKFPTPDAGD